MIVAGGLLWPNVRERKVVVRADTLAEPIEETSEALPGDPLYSKYGWPLEAASQLIGAMSSSHEELYSIPCQPKFHFLMATLDALIALAALTAVWFLCERWTGRCNAREKLPSES